MHEDESYKVSTEFFYRQKSAFVTSLRNPSHDPAIANYTYLLTYSIVQSPS